MVRVTQKACNDHAVLAARSVNAVRDSPVVALHGFTQTGSSWSRLGQALDRTIVAPDLPGHGAASSERPPDLWGAAELVADRARAAGPAVWVGYSLGGRVLLHLALRHPQLVHALVLVSTTAGIEDNSERSARRVADNALADRIEIVGVDAFIDEWLAQPLFAGLVSTANDLAARRSNTAAGLAHSLRTVGTGTQEPLWGRLAEITVPTLVVTGIDDAKFTALGGRLATALPHAHHVQIANAGHACAAQQPDEFARVVAQFINGANLSSETVNDAR